MAPALSRWRHPVMEWLILIAIVLVGIPAAAWLMQDSLLFFPQSVGSTPHLQANAAPLEVVVPDGTHLRGWIVKGAASPAPVVIYFGGNAEEVSWTLSDRRWPRDWTIVGLNYRGYGASEGKPGQFALQADALAIYDAVARRPDVDARRVVVFGRSLGTAMAAHVAAARPDVAGAVLVSPYDSMTAIGRLHYPWLPVSLLLKHRFEAAVDAKRCRTALLTIVGAADSIIPPERSRALYEAWGGSKSWLVVPAAGHNDLAEHEAFWQAIAQFLGER
jgi:pimeloyl-ACP methyl ester carboxylesterase